ncbi:unnamed protein product [Mytilus edulis]|uniref:Uncharacterized protein n=1 Tax=Mytilus edulis TaxID=6550 RepID=A0A8S3RH03_MYTED|nr:unnamed protein product [Mytilus edulis]
MQRQRDDSLRFYKYLCQKIGFEEDVKVRRITSNVCDIGNGRFKQIRSGSNGEGLHLKGSDLDLMRIETKFKVFENKNDIPVQRRFKIPLFMDTEDTQPCFTKLRIECDRTSPFLAERVLSLIIPIELQLEVQAQSYWINPKPFAHFLGFLCCYHLKDSASCNYFIRQLIHDADTILSSNQESYSVCECHILICIGIAMQMFGETSRAKEWLHMASVLDGCNLTSANIRLSDINLHT